MFKISVFYFILVFTCTALAGDPSFSTQPVHAPWPSKKWRIGYIEGGDYIDYKETLLGMVAGLTELGWIPPFDIRKVSNFDTADIWKWLANDAGSDYLQFVDDAFYSAGWAPDARKSAADAVQRWVQQKGDIDLLIAMGTWAGQEMAKRDLDTNVLVMTASDPLASGIIKSPHDSGAENLHAHIDPTLCERQIRIFHDIINFKKMGIIFENSVAGRSYAGIISAERLARELGFDIVPCFALSDIPDALQREKSYLECVDRIAPRIDALYVTAHGCVTSSSIPMIIERAERHKIATFSQSGPQEVESGILHEPLPEKFS